MECGILALTPGGAWVLCLGVGVILPTVDGAPTPPLQVRSRAVPSSSTGSAL